MISLVPQINRPQGKCLRFYQEPANARVRLVCFAWAGGGANFFKRLVSQIPADVSLVAVQLPGREDRFHESRLVRMEQIVQQVVAELLPLNDLPLVLFGHSMGALVAHEVAQALSTRPAHSPQLLIVSGSNAPHLKSCYQRCSNDASEADFLQDIQQLGGTPPALLSDLDFMRSLLPMIRADYAVLDSYRCQSPITPLQCPVIACSGRQDHCVSVEGIRGWEAYTESAFIERWFEGDHFYLTIKQHPWINELTLWLEQGLALDACVI